jgi:DNA-directed RNA polymerase specialized sigma24 family protein
MAEHPDVTLVKRGYEVREIAAAVGIESAAVRKILERARTRLGARLETLLGPDGGRS